MEAELNAVINHAGRLGAEYVEARAQDMTKTIMTVKDGRVETAKEGVEQGVALRVLADGAWGFASVGLLDKQQLKEAVTEAYRMAKRTSLTLKDPVKLAEVKAAKDKVKVKAAEALGEIPLGSKMDVVLAMNKKAFGYDKRVKSCTVHYLDMTETTRYVNSDGANIEHGKLYVWTSMVVTAKQGVVLAEGHEEIGSTRGFGFFQKETPETVAARVAKTAVEQLKAQSPKGGVFPAVIAPTVTGVFVHEAFGHLAEADLTLAGSALTGVLGQKIASEHVTICDDGTLVDGFGSFKYDDEGVPAQKTCLIKRGEFVGLMQNRETAMKFNAAPTGNARAEDFHAEPVIRMRNTYMEKGNHTFEELFEDIKFGYYLKKLQGGEANYDGTFQVGIQEAYEIRNGEIGQLVRNVSISGNTLKTLLRVEAVGKDVTLFPGRCGKEGQTVFMSDGGPHIRVKEVLVGGSA